MQSCLSWHAVGDCFAGFARREPRLSRTSLKEIARRKESLEMNLPSSMFESLFGFTLGRLNNTANEPTRIVAEDGMWKSRRQSEKSDGTILPADWRTSTPSDYPMESEQRPVLAQRTPQRFSDAKQSHDDPSNRYEVGSCCEVFSATSQQWFVAFVIENDGEIATVRFFAQGEMKEKSLLVSDPMIAPLETHVRDMPPQFDCIPSVSRPGHVSYLDITTGVKYLDLQCAWQVHYSSIFKQEEATDGLHHDARRPYPEDVSPASNMTLSPELTFARDNLAPRAVRHPIYSQDPMPMRQLAPSRGTQEVQHVGSLQFPPLADAMQTKSSTCSGLSSAHAESYMRGQETNHKTSLPSFGMMSNQAAYLSAHGMTAPTHAPYPNGPRDERRQEIEVRRAETDPWRRPYSPRGY